MNTLTKLLAVFTLAALTAACSTTPGALTGRVNSFDPSNGARCGHGLVAIVDKRPGGRTECVDAEALADAREDAAEMFERDFDE